MMTATEFQAMREALGMTQAELGRQLGKHRNTIGKYESGDRPIPYTVAQLLPYLLASSHQEGHA